jgi:hypothetical protein
VVWQFSIPSWVQDTQRKGSRVRVGFVTFHGKSYSGSVLLPLIVKPTDVLVESWQLFKIAAPSKRYKIMFTN